MFSIRVYLSIEKKLKLSSAYHSSGAAGVNRNPLRYERS